MWCGRRRRTSAALSTIQPHLCLCLYLMFVYRFLVSFLKINILKAKQIYYLQMFAKEKKTFNSGSTVYNLNIEEEKI